MVETVTGSSGGEGFVAAAQLLHDFNAEYDEPAPPPDELAGRLAELVGDSHVTVLLARARETGAAIGVAVMRVQPSLWSQAQEAYLAELYVVPSWRGQGCGRELITETVRVARGRPARPTPLRGGRLPPDRGRRRSDHFGLLGRRLAPRRPVWRCPQGAAPRQALPGPGPSSL